MNKLKSTLPNMFLSLTGICLVSGGILSGVNMLTAAPIEEAKAKTLETAIRNVVPEFDNSPTKEVYMAATSEGDSLKIYPAKKGDEMIGVAVESITKKGFSGEIKIIVGFDTDGKILNYSVLQHAETPGLGSKMQEWFRTDRNKQNIIGRTMSKEPLKVVKDGGDVDAITAATISSRAFLDAINRAYSAFSQTDVTSGATATDKEGGNK